MKILHVVPSFAPCFQGGGVVNASYEIAKEQVKKGHDVTVYTTDNCTERLNFENNYNVDLDGIKVYYFKNISNKFKNTFTIDTPIKLPIFLKNEINNFDIIHIHEHRHSLAIITVKYALNNNIPYVIQAHGSVLPFFQKESLKNIFDKLWGFNILHNANKVFALTDIEKDQYLEMGVKEENIEIVPLGINLDDYSKLPDKKSFRLKYNIKEDEKLLLFIGRIHKIKGLDLLIKTMNLLKDENIKLAIVGSDYGFLDEVKTLVNDFSLEDKVIFTGPLFDKEKKEALISSDIFIMPSRYESFTTSGLEAMACGIPLVLTKNNHICNWVNNNVGLCSDFDEFDLKNSIETIINNKKLSESFSNNGRKLIKEKYNWDIVVKDILNIYKNLIN